MSARNRRPVACNCSVRMPTIRSGPRVTREWAAADDDDGNNSVGEFKRGESASRKRKKKPYDPSVRPSPLIIIIIINIPLARATEESRFIIIVLLQCTCVNTIIIIEVPLVRYNVAVTSRIAVRMSRWYDAITIYCILIIFKMSEWIIIVYDDDCCSDGSATAVECCTGDDRDEQTRRVAT